MSYVFLFDDYTGLHEIEQNRFSQKPPLRILIFAANIFSLGFYCSIFFFPPKNRRRYRVIYNTRVHDVSVLDTFFGGRV